MFEGIFGSSKGYERRLGNEPAREDIDGALPGEDGIEELSRAASLTFRKAGFSYPFD